MKFMSVFPAFILCTLSAAAFADSSWDCSAISANELAALVEKSVASNDPALVSVAKTNMAMECSRQAELLDKAALEMKNGKKSLETTMLAVKARNNSAALLSDGPLSPHALPRQ